MEDLEEKNPAQWAIDLLEGKNYFYKREWYNVHAAEIIFAITGFSVPTIRNFMIKRPLFTAVWQHILFTLAGVACGKVVTIKTDKYYAKRDAILLDYVKKHPDRFPEPPNRKYADIFNPWMPTR